MKFCGSDIKSNILILGNITNEHQDYNYIYYHFLVLDYGNINVILYPHATFDYNKINKYSLIYYSSYSTNFILYPGCEIKTNNITSNLSNLDFNCSTIYQYNGNLCLNRYVEEKDETNRNKLVGSINSSLHIIYPMNMYDDSQDSKIKAEYTLQQAGKDAPHSNFSTTSYFPTLYWRMTDHVYNEHLWINGVYHFEAPELQLDFIEDESNGNKEVLSIKDNIISKCDVAFWDQCSPDNKNYGILRYITDYNTNANKYINTNTLEDLFYNGKTYGLLNKMPSEIFVGLIGEKDIKISKNNSKNILLLGDNKQYKGTITIPNNTTDIYLKTISKIGKIKYKDKIYYKDNIPNITFHYIDKATLPITPSTSTNTNNNKQSQQNNNINNNINNNNLTQNKNEFKYIFDLKYNNEIKLDLKDNMSTSHDIVLEDNGIIQNTILWLKGDNRDFKGMLITPKNIETVIFYPNSFCKVINPSGKKLKYKFVNEHGNTDDE